RGVCIADLFRSGGNLPGLSPSRPWERLSTGAQMADERLGALEFLANATRAREAHYRERAAHLRVMADDEPLGRLRSGLTGLAEQFEQLADRLAIERR